MSLIDLSNYDTLLNQSTTGGRAGTPNGNIFFDVANGIIELITVEEQATVIITDTSHPNYTDGTTPIANPLTEDDGIKFEALYAFERQERRKDETLRQYDYYFKGTFKFGGAYELVNGRKFYDTDTGGANSNTGDDRFKIRGSGWIERDISDNIGRIYYGNKSLGNIEALSQPYYQLLEGNAGVPVNYDKDGPIDEAIKVYGDNDIDTNAYDTTVATAASQTISVVAATGTFTRSAGDYITDGFEPGMRFEAAGLLNNTGTYTVDTVTTTVITVKAEEWADLTNETGDADEALTVTGIDRRTYESLKIRTFGYNYDEKILADSGVTEMGGYSSGFALGESAHLTTGSYSLADVYGGGQISPWTGMSLEELDTPQTESGFTTADGDFTWVVKNTVPGNLNQVIAFLDALAQTDDDINDHVTNVTRGKRVGTWYTYNAAGKILPRTNISGEGLFIDALSGTDKNRVIFTDDAGDTKEYPQYLNVSVNAGPGAVSDPLAWFHAFFLDGPGAGDDFNTSGALTVQNAQAQNVKGNVDGTGLSVGENIEFEFDYNGDTIGGTAGTDKDIVFECEGDGGVTAAKTVFTLTDPAVAAAISASCVPPAENNV